MQNITRFLILALVASLPLSASATYSPGQLIVRLAAAPSRTMDGNIQSTGVVAMDAMLSSQQATVVSTLAQFEQRWRETESIITLSFSQNLNLDSLENVMASDPGVEWVTRNYHYRPNSLDEEVIPNDSLFSEQWWLTTISAPLAWEITQGDSSVIIGIIDTGVDYLHPDLAPNLWVNWADADSDGIDDDNNGFVDDVIGWDFCDAPTLPAAGDHLVRDNDPMDEPGGLASGHGTYVSGVAAAATNNGTCVASIGNKCHLMCLRAGNSDGYLEEDDIAAAILYGVANGVSIINMSFGDVVASPLLRETVLLAYEAGVVLVASAGNQGSFPQRIHYPSGYSEVIAVGATDQYDRRAGFSNYGPSVEIFAPGDNILSTILGGGCGEWIYPSGTSYASPMVCGVAGLILSVNPQLSPADVAQVIVSTADDIAADDWDPQTAHGRINARHAVEQAQFGSDVVARILTPHVDQGMATDFAVYGEAWGAAFDHYELYYGLGEIPAEWIPVTTGAERHYGDSLGWITLPAQDTVMIVRLESRTGSDSYSIDHVHLHIQRSAPVIESLKIMRMLDYDAFGDLVQVESNQVTTASFILTNTAGDSLREDFGYVSDEHAGVLTQTNHPGTWTVRVRLENRSGFVTYSDPFTFSLEVPPILANQWERSQTNLGNGYLSPFYSDYDCDNLRELWLQPTSGEFTSGPLEPFEWDGAQFAPTGPIFDVHIPQAYGDADGDGLMEMMARFGSTTRIWEQSEPCGGWGGPIYENTQFFIGAGFVDVDSGDGRLEVIARVNTNANADGRPRYAIHSVGDEYVLTLLDTIPNTTPGINELGPPVIRSGDLDQDGLLDFIYGDYDGDIIFCERSDGDIRQVWSTRLPLNDATSWLDRGDLDGDGALEFIAGCRSNSTGGSESQRRSLHWEFFIFERDGDNSFVVRDSLFVLGNEDVRDHPASVTVADVDADERDDVLISAYPDFYIVSFDPVSGRYVPRWYYTPSQSNACIAADWDGDGVKEIFMSDGNSVQRIEAASASGQRPAPPLHLSGEPQSAQTVYLEWNAVSGADSYYVYQAASLPDFQRIAATADTYVVIGSLPDGVEFTYAVTSVDPSFPTPESVFSNYFVAAANTAPTAADTALFIEPHFVRLTFSEPMGASALQQWNYRLDGAAMPDVISPDEAGRVIVLAFLSGLSEGWHTINLSGLRDAQNSALPAEESDVVFEVSHIPSVGPHLVSHRIVGGPSASLVEVTFSEGMSVSVLNPQNYRMDAPRRVLDVSDLAADHRRVQLQLDPRYPVGALDIPARIMLRNLTNANGVPMDTTSGQADIVLGGAAANISDAFVYPNPFKGIGPNGERAIVFAGLPERATIRVFTIQGVLVRRLEHENASGASRWDLTNDDGEIVASGVYLYTAESNGETVRGKLAILR